MFKSSSLQLLLYLILWLPASAQQFIPKVQAFDENDGLSSTNIIQVLQDSRGLIWIGTSYGLNRYDGISFKSYTAEESGLCHNYIMELTEDDQGHLWILAGPFDRQDRYICIFDPIKEVFYSIEEYTGAPAPFGRNKVGLSPKYRGTILLKENQERLFQFYEIHSRSLHKGFVLPKSDSIDENSTYFPAFKLDEQTYVASYHSSLPQHIGTDFFRAVYFNQRGKISAARTDLPESCDIFTDGQSVYYHFGDWITDRRKTIYRDSQLMVSINDPNIQVVVNDAQSIYALGSYTLEAYQMPSPKEQAEHLQTIHFSEKLETEGDAALLDNDNNLWINGRGNIYKISLNRNIFESPLQDDNEGWSIPVRGIDSSPDGSLYSGNMFHLYIKDAEGKEKRIKSINGLNFRGTLGILYDEQSLWVAREQYGLWRYHLNNGRIERFGFGDEGKYNPLTWIPYKSADGNIWVGSGGGLLKLDEQKRQLRHFRNYNNFESLANSSVYAFYRNERGTWVSSSSGLYLVDLQQEKVLEHYGPGQEGAFYLPAEHVAHTYEDKDGTFWLATKGQGLVRWDPQTGDFKQFTKRGNGLSHDVLYAVYEDDYDNLWLPSTYGLMCFHKESHEITVFLKEDGLPHNEFNTIAHHQSADGRLHFGTQDGLISFHPSDFSFDKKEMPLILTACQKIERSTDSLINVTSEVLETKQLLIEPKIKSVQLHFALLNYKNPKGNQYSYKINGFHTDWKYDAGPAIRIDDLPYGNYQLQFRGKVQGSGSWVEYQNPIAIRVIRPIYLRWWFILASIGISIGLIYLLIKKNNQQLRKRQLELEQIVEERTAEIREQARQLEALDQLKSNFFSNISHELRTPLSLILGSVKSLLKVQNLPPKQNQLLEIAERSGNKLGQLINEILDLRKLESGKMQLKQQPTNVPSFFALYLGQFDSLAESKHIDFSWDIEADTNFVVALDQEKCRQILYNLLSNAFKYTPPNGSVHAKIEALDEKLQLSVSDNGLGIHPEDLPHIFDHYFQSNRPDKPVEGGTGIGLAICQEYTQLFGGEITVESQPGEGTQFTLWFPVEVLGPEALSAPPAEEMEAVAALNLPLSKDQLDVPGDNSPRPRILAVEDNPDLRAFIRLILEPKYELTLAENGQAAVEVLKRSADYDLILSDIMMPIMDGFQLLEHIKSNDATRHIPVIMLTARAATRDKLKALRIGVDDYMIKPFLEEELIVRIDNLLRNHSLRLSFSESEPDKSPQQPIMSEDDREWLAEFEAYIQENLSLDILSVSMLSNEFAMSESTFLRQLKRLTGLTPQQYLIEVRLEEARRLIENRKYGSIQRIAAQVGYKDTKAFSKRFKKRFGSSPSVLMNP